MMTNFVEPKCDIIRFTNELLHGDSCNCDLGDGPEGDTVCSNPVPGGDYAPCDPNC